MIYRPSYLFYRWEENIFEEKTTVWVDVDLPTKTCTIHGNLDCLYTVEKKETGLKGLNELRTEGGWFSFEGPQAAEDYCLRLKDKKDLKTINWCC